MVLKSIYWKLSLTATPTETTLTHRVKCTWSIWTTNSSIEIWEEKKCRAGDPMPGSQEWGCDPQFHLSCLPCSLPWLLSMSPAGEFSGELLCYKRSPECALTLVFLCYSLWQDAQNRVYLTKELDRITGQVCMILLISLFEWFLVFGFSGFAWTDVSCIVLSLFDCALSMQWLLVLDPLGRSRILIQWVRSKTMNTRYHRIAVYCILVWGGGTRDQGRIQ